MFPPSKPPGFQPEFSPERQGLGRRREDVRNEQLTNLLSLIPDGVVCIDHAWRITYANLEGRRISQIDERHIETSTIWEMFPQLLGTALEDAYHAVMQSGVPTHLEHFSTRQDIWLDIHILPMEEGIAVVYRDTTDRKGAELLRDSASRQLLQVLEATSDAVVSLDRDGTFTFLNRRARELLSVKGDLIGKNIWSEFPFARDHGQYLLHFDRRDEREGIAGDFEDLATPDPLQPLALHPDTTL